MSGYLLDTNVISETRKIRADKGVMAFFSRADQEGLFLSVLTLGELRKGVKVKRRSDPDGADQLGVWLDGIQTIFANHILGIDVSIASYWGEMSTGPSLPVVDTLIAATAISHDLTLVTRNTRDFVATGVKILDPWQIR